MDRLKNRSRLQLRRPATYTAFCLVFIASCSDDTEGPGRDDSSRSIARPDYVDEIFDHARPDQPHTRELIRLLAKRIAPPGFTHFAAEALQPDALGGDPVPYARTNYGNYVNEPVFGRLIRTVKDLGMTLVEARYRDEPMDAVPVDRVLRWPGESVPLLLPPGAYTIAGFHEDAGGQRDAVVNDFLVEDLGVR